MALTAQTTVSFAAAGGSSRGAEETATALLAASCPAACRASGVGIVTAAAEQQEGTADSLTEEFCESDKFDSRCIITIETTGYPQKPSPREGGGHPCKATGQQTGRRRPDR